MEHQSHSNGNTAPDHQPNTTSASSPSFRVYVDMGMEQYANEAVVYSSPQEDVDKTCVDTLSDDAHYRFSCRCGCGAQFAGYGKDIKAAARVGGDITAYPADPQIGDQWFDQRANALYVCADHNGTRPTWSRVEPSTNLTASGSSNSSKLLTVWILGDATDLVDDCGEDSQDDVEGDMEVSMPSEHPYVSDRYLKKAQFGLTDKEVSAYSVGKEDPLEAMGVVLSMRQPPAIADLVYSLATGEGPMTLLEYAEREIKLEDGVYRILCGICRNERGAYTALPLADLATHYVGRAVPDRDTKSWFKLALMMLASGVGGSAIGLVGRHYAGLLF